MVFLDSEYMPSYYIYVLVSNNNHSLSDTIKQL